MRKIALILVLLSALQTVILSGCGEKKAAGECCGSLDSHIVQVG